MKCHITEVSRLRAKIKGDLPRENKIDYQTGIANVEPLKCKLQVVYGQRGFTKLWHKMVVIKLGQEECGSEG